MPVTRIEWGPQHRRSSRAVDRSRWPNKGVTQIPNDKTNNSNRVGTRSGGPYHSSDNRSIFGNRNGNRLGQDSERGVDPNVTTNTTTADGMEHYSVNLGYIDVRFMCGNGKGFNVARGIKQFMSFI
jgi:hypothetical protein